MRMKTQQQKVWVFSQLHLASDTFSGQHVYMLSIHLGSEGQKQKQEPLPTLTPTQLLIQRKMKLEQLKQKIAVLSSSVVENPEESVSEFCALKTNSPVLLLAFLFFRFLVVTEKRLWSEDYVMRRDLCRSDLSLCVVSIWNASDFLPDQQIEGTETNAGRAGCRCFCHDPEIGFSFSPGDIQGHHSWIQDSGGDWKGKATSCKTSTRFVNGNFSTRLRNVIYHQTNLCITAGKEGN